MKMMKKTNQQREFLLTLPVAGMVLVGLGFATPVLAGPFNLSQPHFNTPAAKRAANELPDLKVSMRLDRSTLRKTNPQCRQRCTWDYTVIGSVKNIGGKAFVPLSANAQALGMYGGPGLTTQQIRNWPFGRLNPGQKMSVSMHAQRQPGPEVARVSDYTMRIVFGPDSPGDRNRSNNQARLSRRSIVSAMNHAHAITVRPVGQSVAGVIKHKPDLIPQVINAHSGAIRVKNIGTATAGVSQLSIICSRLKAGRSTPCAAGLHLPNYNASYNQLIFKIPALRPGASHQIRLWGVGGIPLSAKVAGVYGAKLDADWNKHVAESNETNNYGRLDVTIRGKAKSGFGLR
jgi:hypothetical protein